MADKLASNRDPYPETNRGEDFNGTIEDIENECDRVLASGDPNTLLDAIQLIKYLCVKTQTDEVD